VRTGELVFVDTGAWIALALTRDPLHARARATWEPRMWSPADSAISAL
jgi:predicted nucleic acid-binding protein